jgi:hypothetical protein
MIARPLSDLSLDLRAGVFLPGAAFETSYSQPRFLARLAVTLSI